MRMVGWSDNQPMVPIFFLIPHMYFYPFSSFLSVPSFRRWSYIYSYKPRSLPFLLGNDTFDIHKTHMKEGEVGAGRQEESVCSALLVLTSRYIDIDCYGCWCWLMISRTCQFIAILCWCIMIDYRYRCSFIRFLIYSVACCADRTSASSSLVSSSLNVDEQGRQDGETERDKEKGCGRYDTLSPPPLPRGSCPVISATSRFISRLCQWFFTSLAERPGNEEEILTHLFGDLYVGR